MSGSEPTMVAHPPMSTPAPASSPPLSSSGYLPPFSATDSIAPAATTTPPAAPSSGRLGLRIAAGAGTLAAAMLSGLLLGQSLASHTATRAMAAGGVASDVRVDAPAARAAATPAAPSPAPTETAAPIVVTDGEGAATVTVKAPRPAHHGVKKTPKAAASREASEKSQSAGQASGGESNK